MIIIIIIIINKYCLYDYYICIASGESRARTGRRERVLCGSARETWLALPLNKLYYPCCLLVIQSFCDLLSLDFDYC